MRDDGRLVIKGDIGIISDLSDNDLGGFHVSD